MSVLKNRKEYEFTQSRLRWLKSRLAEFDSRTDLSVSVKAAAGRSYGDMIGQLTRELEEYEAAQKSAFAAAS